MKVKPSEFHGVLNIKTNLFAFIPLLCIKTYLQARAVVQIYQQYHYYQY